MSGTGKKRFWMTYTNERERTYGASISDGYAVHPRGWDAGVKVTPRPAGENSTADSFEVTMTWGSHASGQDVILGTVYDTPSGPVWVPASVPGKRRKRSIPDSLRTIRRPRRPRPASSEHSPASSEHSPAYVAAIATEPERTESDLGPDATLARIDKTLAGPSLDSAVFGPEQRGPGPLVGGRTDHDRPLTDRDMLARTMHMMRARRAVRRDRLTPEQYADEVAGRGPAGRRSGSPLMCVLAG